MKQKILVTLAASAVLGSSFMLGTAFAVTPSLIIDNDTLQSLPYKTWTDTVILTNSDGTKYAKELFDKDPNRQSTSDYSRDSRIANAQSASAYYHWDLPVGTNTVYNYKIYVHLANNYFTNTQAIYYLDQGYETSNSFTLNQQAAAVGWNVARSGYSDLVAQTYGVAHLKVWAGGPTGTWTGADAIGLTRQ